MSEPLAEDVPIEAQLQFSGDLAKARVHRLVAISEVPDTTAEAITARGVTETTIDDAMLKGLVEVGVLTTTQARGLGATVGIYRLLDNSPALTERITTLEVESVAGGRITRPQHLVHLGRADWARVIMVDGGVLPPGLTADQYVTVLSKRAALAFPTEAMLARVRPPDVQTLRVDLERLEAVLGRDGLLSGGVDLSDIPETLRDTVTRMRRLVDGHPGLALAEVLEDKSLALPARMKKVRERVGLLARLAEANPDVELLGLDLSAGSEDLAALAHTTTPASERKYAIGALKAQQRLLAIVRDPDDVTVLAEAGYESAQSIVAAGMDRFVANTGLKADVAVSYFGEAMSAVSQTGSAAVSVLDAVSGGFNLVDVANVSPGIGNYFRGIDGWDELFGSQDYCRCEHCSSILGPAAYFVDLMHFVEEHLIGRGVQRRKGRPRPCAEGQASRSLDAAADAM